MKNRLAKWVSRLSQSKFSTSIHSWVNTIATQPVSLGSVREVQIEELLRRKPIGTDVYKERAFLLGKKVLITGAGGSIGSELCRQILKCRPAEILVVGHGENSVFNIQQELRQIIDALKKEGEPEENIPYLTAFIVDIRSTDRLRYAFEKFRPDVVFHAAAHKHVPMMELNPPEAITNNVRGTKNVLDLALEYNVQHFVMISTDKAVNPTNIMGASKRVAEMLVLQAAQKSKKPYVVVRFGNVLGSRGSVVPTFKQQIAKGGPITITHPDICRYFMTIPEAVQLVLQAVVLGKGGEVFMFDMGEPVKIVDLAKDLIRLSGYQVGKDIDIVFTGLRPGEKLFEELFIPGEEYTRTQHEKIMTVGNASRIVPESINSKIEALCGAADRNESNLIIFLLEQLVPEYTPQYSSSNFYRQGLNQNNKVMPADLLMLAKGNEKHEEANTVRGYGSIDFNLKKDLPKALERQEFLIYYQPIMNLDTHQTIGLEALLRWQHPNYGLVNPIDFISMAEETGLIMPIGLWALRQACQQMKAWQDRLPIDPKLTIGVNLSCKQFFHPNLSKHVAQILVETNLNPYNLRLEIPESAIGENSELATTVFCQLKALGVKLQIDNCGISNSSIGVLSFLINLSPGKIDSLKLDTSLVKQIDTSNAKLEILQKIMPIAQELDIAIVATGIETIQQIEKLRSLKCVDGQGYFFSRPVEPEKAIALIGARARN